MPEERRNLYRILHVQPEAPLEVIRASYRTLMSTLRAHPDLGGDDETAARINTAYAVLTDPERRRAYDESLARPRQAPAAPPLLVRASDAAAWLADRVCPFCRTPLPALVHRQTRCGTCESPLFRRPTVERGELFGRRRTPRNPRPLQATLRLPGDARDHPARLKDLSLSGLALLSPVPAPERSPMRVMTAQFDTVAVVVGARRQQGGWLLHGELLTLQLLAQQGVFVSERV